MKQILQSYKTGEVLLRDVPVPLCGPKKVLVRNCNSLISLGTERSIIELGKKSILGKAVARPDLVRRAIDKAKKEGLIKMWNEAMGRLDSPTALGYSCSGLVMECGISASEFSPGDRVACIGQGFASHAEFVSVPVNLVCRIPEGVSEEDASFGMIGIIALHGIRNADLTFGSRVVVMGLGLLGLLTVQILRAYGCKVIAVDPSKEKMDLAHKFSAICPFSPENSLSKIVNEYTEGHGADAIIITASTTTRDPVDMAIKLSRPRGKIVIVGTADIHPDRNELWHKELQLVVSKAAGPGSLDPLYEIEGVDFPIGDVRWTQKRNLQEFLRLLADKKIDLGPLITHRFLIDEADLAYEQLISGKLKNPIGVLLEYSGKAIVDRFLPAPKKIIKNKGEIQVGVIGAGLFGKALLLPALQKQSGVNLHTLVTESSASSEHSGRKFGFNFHSTDDEKIWTDPTIGAVFGLTPHSNHIELVRKAIKFKKPLFLEKPLCISTQELDWIAQEAEEFGMPLVMVGHNRRYSIHTKKICDWLMGNKSPIVINMRVNAGFLFADHWVHSEAEGRSRIVGEMSHFIDLCQFIAKSRIHRISAERVSGNNKSIINNDNVVINFKFENGSIGSLTYTALGSRSYSREFIEVFFDGNVIVSDDFRVTTFYESGRAHKFKSRNQEMGYREELSYFFNCLTGEQDLAIQQTDMIRTMAVIFAIESSLATGQSVSL